MDNSIFSNVSQAVKIKTDYLKDELISAFDGTSNTLTPKQVKIVFKVTEQNSSDNVLVNIAEISKAQDKDRNEIILDILKKHKDDYTLVLSDRLSQLEYLQEQLGYGVKIDGKMTSKTAKAQREKCIQDMRDGKEHLMLSSYLLAKEGLDIPRLSVLILASPHKDSATIIQSIRQNRKKI